MMPLIAFSLLDGIELLAAGTLNLANRCVKGLAANRAKAHQIVEHSFAMAVALTPEIGYDRAAAIVKEAHETGRTLREVALDRSGLDQSRVDELLRIQGM